MIRLTINERKTLGTGKIISVDNIFAVCGFGTNKSTTLSVVKALKVLTVTANNILNGIYSTPYVPTVKIFFFFEKSWKYCIYSRTWGKN